MKTSRWMKGLLGCGGAGIAVVALGAGCSSAPSNETSASPGATTASEITATPYSDEWRRLVSKTPPPKAGCFRATGPGITWHEVPCGVPVEDPLPMPKWLEPIVRSMTEPGAKPSHRNTLAAGAAPAVNSSGTDSDYSAAVSGLLSWAEGSFPSESGGVGEELLLPDGGARPNAYSFQLNTNLFSSFSSCSLSTNCTSPSDCGCLGWQQFAYDPIRKSIYIEYSLINFEGQCPPGFPGSYTVGTTHVCYDNTPPHPVPAELASSVHDMVMAASTSDATGAPMDSITLTIAGTAPFVMSNPSVLGVASGWSAAEFNLFGEAGGERAHFPDATSLQVKLLLETTPSSTDAPFCSAGSTTGESSDLLIQGPCCSFGGAAPGIQFFETNTTAATPACPGLTISPSPLSVAQGSCGTFSASLAPGSIVPPITIDVTKTDLPSDAQPTGGGTTQDGAVTFSVCPTLNDAVGTYHVQLTSSGSVPADDFIDGMNVSITACQPIPEPTLCSSGAYAACGSFGDGCGGTVLCPACAAGSSCSNDVCCPTGLVGTNGSCCPSGEVYYEGIGCRAPCAPGTIPCPIAGGCETPAICTKINNGPQPPNCARAHTCM